MRRGLCPQRTCLEDMALFTWKVRKVACACPQSVSSWLCDTLFYIIDIFTKLQVCEIFLCLRILNCFLFSHSRIIPQNGISVS
jgi:hypothetical protein